MRTAVRYATAALIVAAAAVLTSTLTELLEPMQLFFLWAAVLISALVGGTGPGILAALLAVIIAGIVIFTPVHSPTLNDVIRLVLIAVFVGGLGVTVGRMKTLTRKLRRGELRYRALVEAAPVGQAVWTADPDGTMKDAPKWLDDMHPDDAVHMRERWHHAMATETLYEDEVRIRLVEGRQRWFAIRAAPVRDDDERIVEWVAMIADIHDRKRHEDNAAFITRASEVLSATTGSQQTLRNLAHLCVPALGDWCAVDLGDGPGYERGIVEHADPARVKMFLELDQRFRAAPDSDPILQALRRGQAQLVEEVTDELLKSLMVSQEQLTFLRGLGLRSWIVAPMIARGRTLGALSVVNTTDSGRRHSAEDVPVVEELARRAAIAVDNARLYEIADAANRAKEDFLSTFSHELRTPLTAIAGWAHMLQSGIDDPQTSRLAIETIANSARTQQELIDELLDLSRAADGTLRLNVEAIDVVRIAQEVFAAAKTAANAKDIQLELTAPSPAFLRGDARRLRQVIWNLVSNALKFTDPDGHVGLSVRSTGPTVRVEVSDTGRGIDPSFLPFVWDRFRQADTLPFRQYGGLGLGLSVVRHFVEMHGGTVYADSAGLGRGATFCVEIPVSRVSDAKTMSAAASGEARMQGVRILLVEDDESTRAMMATMLSKFGADVAPASSVGEALRMVDARAFDVVVSDIGMPGEDGYFLAGRLKPRLPVIAVSAIVTGDDDRRHALDRGFSDFVSKPVDPQELVRAVLRAVH